MRKFAITGIVVVLLVLGVGATIMLRTVQGGGVPPSGANSGGGGGPGLPFIGRSGGANASSSATLQSTTVEQGDVTLTISATGHVVSKQQTNLSFQQSGIVKTVTVMIGDKVKAGTVLATLDNSAEQTSLVKAENSLKAAQTALDKLLQPVSKADIDSAEADVKSAMASYQSAAHSGTSQAGLKAYQLQYEQALKGVEAANYAVAGAGGQYSKDDPNYQKAIASVGSAQVAADQAKLNLQKAQNSGADLSQETANIAYAQAKLAQVKAGPSQSDIDSAQAQIEVAKVQLLQAQHNVELAQLVAPFDGVVSTVNVKAGEVSSSPAFVLVDTSALYVDISVDEADIAAISVGLPVHLTLDALPDATLTGKVQRVSPLADTSSTSVVIYTVRIVLDPTNLALKTGMTASATFTVSNVHNVIRVPNSYLKVNKTYNQTTVNLINRDGTTTLVPVTLGVQGTDYSEVINGLRVGDRLSVTAISTTNSISNNVTGLPVGAPPPQGAGQ
jgi:HlyD family secretion protein